MEKARFMYCKISFIFLPHRAHYKTKPAGKFAFSKLCFFSTCHSGTRRETVAAEAATVAATAFKWPLHAYAHIH